MPDTKTEAPDPTALWREWFNQTERQLNSFLNESMASEDFSGQLSRIMDLYLFSLKNTNEVMGRYFMALNFPTRADVLQLGERLLEIESRLASIESQLAVLLRPAPDAPTRPPRTKQPPIN